MFIYFTQITDKYRLTKFDIEIYLAKGGRDLASTAIVRGNIVNSSILYMKYF